MSSGLLALLDDVAAIAKAAAASADDVAAMSAKAGSKAAGVVIDDAAVTPRYVVGLNPARELPIVMKIAKGSFFNKLVILLPGALVLSLIAPWAITPILMLGGLFLCYEGAEKVLELFRPPAPKPETAAAPQDAAMLENTRVAAAVRTDLILSAEIMAITLSTLTAAALWEQAVVLALVGIVITIAVYGAVALIVKADDMGLALAGNPENGALLRGFGRGLVRAMPGVLFVLAKVGMVAMLWVGGGILLHGAEVLGWHAPYAQVHHWVEAVQHSAGGALGWLTGALAAALLGLGVGLVLVPVIHRLPLGDGH